MAEIESGSGNISFGGLSSNLDTNKIVGAMVDAQRVPMAKIEQQQATIDAHTSLLQGILTRVNALGELARSMENIAKLLPQQASSSNEQVVRASAGLGAKEGVHRITVLQLAKATRALSAPIPSKAAPDAVTVGRIGWQTDGEAQSFEVTEQMSLEDVSEQLSRANKGLMASVLHDGSNYRLSVHGTKIGSDQALSITDSTNLGLAATESTLVDACDASFLLDGQIAMTRPTNLVTDAIEGVTLRLEGVGPEQVISVTADIGHLVGKIEQFVERYNDIREAIDLATRPTREYERSRLVGDGTLRNLADTLQRSITGAVPGLVSNVTSLGAIGVTSDKEGKLEVDSTRLLATLTDQPAEVARLLGRDHRSGVRGVSTMTAQVCEQYGSPLTGTLTLRMQSMARQKYAAEGRLAQMQNNLERFETTTRKKFTELERTMTIMKAQNDKLQQQMKSLQRKD